MPRIGNARVVVLLLALLCLVPGHVSAAPNPPGPPASSPGEPTSVIPYRAEEAFSSAAMVRVLLALMVAIALAVAVLYALKRYYFRTGVSGAPGQRVRLLEARRLAPRLVLFLVQVDAEVYVLAQSGDSLVSFKHGSSGAPAGQEGSGQAGYG